MQDDTFDELAARYYIADFTEDGYRRLIDLVSAQYRFASFCELPDVPHVLWRHDVDSSVHRARRLAAIEAEAGIFSTYFFMLRSRYYNLFESEVSRKAREIASAGHRIGLHYSTEHLRLADDIGAIEQEAAWERDTLSRLLDAKIEAVSFHNPPPSPISIMRQDSIATMVNAFSDTFKRGYVYCSDSNGYWRFKRLHDLVDARINPRLHVLTHPEWWTPTGMTPRERIGRCIDGRAAAQHMTYDKELREHGRENVRSRKLPD